MVRGTIAKQNFANKLKEVFGAAYIGEVDKKLYINIDDGGEMVQLAISMTCPKVPVGTVDTTTLSYNAGRNFDDSDVVAVAPDKVEISEEERATIRELMKRMGL